MATGFRNLTLGPPIGDGTLRAASTLSTVHGFGVKGSLRRARSCRSPYRSDPLTLSLTPACASPPREDPNACVTKRQASFFIIRRSEQSLASQVCNTPLSAKVCHDNTRRAGGARGMPEARISPLARGRLRSFGFGSSRPHLQVRRRLQPACPRAPAHPAASGQVFSVHYLRAPAGSAGEPCDAYSLDGPVARRGMAALRRRDLREP